MIGYEKLTDFELTVLLKQGDAKAFDEVYHRYSKVLYGIAYNRLRNLSQSEDIVHDVLVSLWKNREFAEIENLKAYLATATKYMIFHEIKRIKKLPVAGDELASTDHVADHEDLEDRLHYKNLLEVARQEVERLPGKCRLIFKYSRYENLTAKEIAEKLDLSQSTVENQINKAVVILRKKIKNFHILLF